MPSSTLRIKTQVRNVVYKTPDVRHFEMPNGIARRYFCGSWQNVLKQVLAVCQTIWLVVTEFIQSRELKLLDLYFLHFVLMPGAKISGSVEFERIIIAESAGASPCPALILYCVTPNVLTALIASSTFHPDFDSRWPSKLKRRLLCARLFCGRPYSRSFHGKRSQVCLLYCAWQGGHSALLGLPVFMQVLDVRDARACFSQRPNWKRGRLYMWHFTGPGPEKAFPQLTGNGAVKG